MLQTQGERVDLEEEEARHFRRLDVVLSKHLTQRWERERYYLNKLWDLRQHARSDLDKANYGKWEYDMHEFNF